MSEEKFNGIAGNKGILTGKNIGNVSLPQYNCGIAGNTIPLQQNEIVSGGINLFSDEIGTLSYSRSSIAHNPYTDTFVSVDEARIRPININGINYNNMHLNGCGSTNELTQTTDIYNDGSGGSGWVKGSGVTLSEIGTYSVGVSFTGASSREYFSSITLTGNTEIVISGQFKNVSGSVTLEIQENFGSFTIVASKTLTNTTGTWGQESLYISGLTIGQQYRWKISGSQGSSVDMRYVQLEIPVAGENNNATSFIATNGSPASRSTDLSTNIFNIGFVNSGTAFSVIIPNFGSIDDRNIPRVYQQSSLSATFSGGNLFINRGDGSDSNQIQFNVDNYDDLFTIAHTWDGTTQKHKLYVDGVYEKDTNTETTFVTLDGKLVYIGNISSGVRCMDSWLFTIFWEKALSDAEITEIQNSISLP